MAKTAKTNIPKSKETTKQEPPKQQPQIVTSPPCSRCGGDGWWHSTKTGYRAATSSEPLIDKSKLCPKCKGTGKV